MAVTVWTGSDSRNIQVPDGVSILNHTDHPHMITVLNATGKTVGIFDGVVGVTVDSEDTPDSS